MAQAVIDFTKIRVLPQCDSCDESFGTPTSMVALDQASECGTCLRLVVAEVLEMAAKIAEDAAIPGHAVQAPSCFGIAKMIREAAKAKA